VNAARAGSAGGGRPAIGGQRRALPTATSAVGRASAREQAAVPEAPWPLAPPVRVAQVRTPVWPPRRCWPVRPTIDRPRGWWIGRSRGVPSASWVPARAGRSAVPRRRPAKARTSEPLHTRSPGGRRRGPSGPSAGGWPWWPPCPLAGAPLRLGHRQTAAAQPRCGATREGGRQGSSTQRAPSWPDPRAWPRWPQFVRRACRDSRHEDAGALPSARGDYSGDGGCGPCGPGPSVWPRWPRAYQHSQCSASAGMWAHRPRGSGARAKGGLGGAERRAAGASAPASPRGGPRRWPARRARARGARRRPRGSRAGHC
jgi:hypothetical protein